MDYKINLKIFVYKVSKQANKQTLYSSLICTSSDSTPWTGYFPKKLWFPFSEEQYLKIKNWVLGVLIIIGMLLFPDLSVDRSLYTSSQRYLHKNSYAALFIKAQSWK